MIICYGWGILVFCQVAFHPPGSFAAVVQSLSHVQLFTRPWTATCQSSLPFSISQSSFNFMSTEWVMQSSHLILCHCLLLLPSIFPSLRVFSKESALHIRWQKYWSFSFSNHPSNNIQDWFPLWLTSLNSLHSKGLSRVFSSTAVQKHQFFAAQPSWLSNSHIHTRLLEKPKLWLDGPFLGKYVSAF